MTVALANNPGGATLGGTLTATASNGVATFSGLTLNKAASGYTLDVSGSGLGEGVTSAITVTPAAATQVVITQQPPASVTVGQRLRPASVDRGRVRQRGDDRHQHRERRAGQQPDRGDARRHALA